MGGLECLLTQYVTPASEYCATNNFFVTVLSHGLWELTMAEPHEEGYVQQLKGTA